MRTDFIGDSPLVEALRHQLHAAAPTDLTVLLLGETGTGKGIAARYLHAHSHRAQGPLVYVNCGGAQAALIDSELFGHEKGAFTGAIATRPGKFERAQGGTIFLDEIGDLPAEAQTRLLQVLQEGRIERVGSTGVRPVDVRVLAATHCNLEQAVRQQRFRADLYYRLKVMPVQLPPLRLHPEDMPTLVAHFIEHSARQLDYSRPLLHPEALADLTAYLWPGNVRELEHVMQRAVVLAQPTGQIRPEHLDLTRTLRNFGEAPEGSGILPLAEYERRYVARVLRLTEGVIHGTRGAARLLDIKPTTLRSRMAKLGIGKKGQLVEA